MYKLFASKISVHSFDKHAVSPGCFKTQFPAEMTLKLRVQTKH